VAGRVLVTPGRCAHWTPVRGEKSISFAVLRQNGLGPDQPESPLVVGALLQESPRGLAEATHVRGMGRIILLISGLALTTAGAVVHAEPSTTLYELQERCGKSANEVFAKEYDYGRPRRTGDTESFSNYQAHYNLAAWGRPATKVGALRWGIAAR
jgi:hypothetical protein